MSANALIDDAARLEEKDREHFDRIAETYSRKDTVRSCRVAREYQVRRCIASVLKETGKIGTIIEVGCGIGRAAKYLKGQYDKYIGIDQSLRLIEVARLFNADCPAEFLCENIKSSSLPDGIGDVVILIGALHHMTEMDAIMGALQRIARPGAAFVALEPNRGNPLIMGLRRIRQKIDAAYSEDQRYFSRRELIELLERHRFCEIQVQYQGYVSPPFAEVMLRPQLIFALLSRMAVAVDHALDSHLPGALRFLSWNLLAQARFPS